MKIKAAVLNEFNQPWSIEELELADPKEGDVVLASITDRLDLSLDPPVTESAGHENPVHVPEIGLGSLLFDLFH